ncbi:hypothetical protein E4U51_001457 [Claviceps purpurea]|nr:hypothetical protein E4U51_001457 [Claviceps purpurea]
MLCCRDPICVVVGFPRCFQRSVRVFEDLLDASAWTKFRVEVPKISALPDSFATMMNVERKSPGPSSPAYAKGKVPGGVSWQKTGTNSRGVFVMGAELASSALPAHWPKIKSQPNEELNTPRPVFARVLAATTLPGLAMETSPNTMSASIMKTPPCSRWRLGLATYRAKGHGEHKERGIALPVKRGTPVTWMWNPREELILPDAITSAGLMAV